MNEVNNLALGKAGSNVHAQLFEESWWVEDSHFTFHSASIVNHWEGYSQCMHILPRFHNCQSWWWGGGGVGFTINI